MSAKNVRQAFEEFYRESGDLVQIDTKVPEIGVSGRSLPLFFSLLEPLPSSHSH
jgi:hypothetical protein